jgi:stage V sporulation protein R
MQLIDQHAKAIMEECKVRAKDAGLQFESDTLEYIVSNRDLLELSPKVMIPTLYDYWVNDVEVLKEIGKYKAFPHNPYETVINSRPAISFYNDNNPDWLNIMIFYHVLAHIDFFQHNRLFANTWNDDFVGQALADKRLIASLRSEHGRWVDYAIEFSRGINNLNGYFNELMRRNFPGDGNPPTALDFYFGDFLQEMVKASESEVYNEVARYNALAEKDENVAENLFFSEVKSKYPEFQNKYNQYLSKTETEIPPMDLVEFIRDNSPFLRREKNKWVKSVMSVVRNTAVYFEPQIRTKIINEGWASYWHDELFRRDERIKGHEIAYAKINAMVTSVSRVGLNPYAIGLRLIQYVEELADKGKLTFAFQKIENIEQRESYDRQTSRGKEAIFNLRSNFSDFTLIKTFVSQEFVDKNNLFVTGKRYDEDREVYQYYVKSRKAEDYQTMLIESLYHPPLIFADTGKTTDERLYLVHKFEGKPLIHDFIENTMLGIEYLWGAPVHLETTELVAKNEYGEDPEWEPRKVIYIMKNRRLSKKEL